MVGSSRQDAGETLVEILVALAILGIGITALLGALATNAISTGVNRDQSHSAATLAAAAEYVKALPTPGCGTAAVDVPTTDVPRDASLVVRYGPAVAFDASTPCSELVRVPVTVVWDGVALTADVVKQP